jgi:hypothetical protein
VRVFQRVLYILTAMCCLCGCRVSATKVGAVDGGGGGGVEVRRKLGMSIISGAR